MASLPDRPRHRGTGPVVAPARPVATPGDARDLVERACPLCGGSSGRDHIEKRAPVDPETISADERAGYWRGFRSWSCFFDFARCPDCGLLYCPTYLSEEALRTLYSSMPDNTAGAPADVLRLTQQRYIDFLGTQGRLRGTYLEIGPDIGLATAAARRAGHLDTLALVEPNRAVHGQLLDAAGPVPTNVVNTLDELPPATNADVAVVVHVLDHISDPVGYLGALRGHLAPGAHMLAVVHNESSWLRHALGVRWPPFCLQHPQLFSPATLTAVIEAAGFHVVDWKPTTNTFPFRHLVKMGATLVGIDGRWVEHVPGFNVSLRLGNTMMVARS